MPCPGPFHFSHIADYIYNFCPLSDPDVGLSILASDVKHTAFHFGLETTRINSGVVLSGNTTLNGNLNCQNST